MNEVVIKIEDLAATLATSYQFNDDKEHSAVCIALKVMLDNPEFYKQACEIAKEIIKK